MQSNGRFEDRHWLARVQNGDGPESRYFGSGFAIDGSHVLTCAHVVQEAGGNGPGSKVYLRFLFNEASSGWATVLTEGWKPPPTDFAPQSAGDTAILEMLDRKQDLKPLELTTHRPRELARITGQGFPAGHPEGNAAGGRLGPAVGLEWVRIEQDSPGAFAPGYSGGPLWCEDVQGCVGMIVTRDFGGVGAAYAIALETAAKHSSLLRRALAGAPLSWRRHGSIGIRSHITNSSQLLEDGAKDFVGRTSIIQHIDERLRKAEGGYTFVEAKPGLGKSALLAKLAVTRGWVHHFNVFTDNVRSPTAFLNNVCAQLVARYQLPYAELPPNAGDNSTFFTNLLTEARDRCEGAVVVLVDALDEAEPQVGGVNRLNLPGKLPRDCHIIATNRVGRPHGVVTDGRTKTYELQEKSPENESDIKEYVQLIVSKDWGRYEALIARWRETLDSFINALWHKSEGNFMYVTQVLPAISDQFGSLGDSLQATLPDGLVDYYEQHWRRMISADQTRFKNVQEPIICLLAAAGEAVTSKAIASWINDSQLYPRIDDYDVTRVLSQEWGQYVHRDKTNPQLFRIYHLSFLDFLKNKVDLDSFHRLRAKVFEGLVSWDESDF